MNARYPDDPDIQSFGRDTFNAYGLTQRNIVPLSIVDAMDDSYRFLQLRRSMLDYVEGGKITQTGRDIVRWGFRPIRSRSSDLASQLQSHGLFSALDAAILILIHRETGRPLSGEASARLVDSLPSQLLRSWHDLSAFPIDLAMWEDDPDDPQFCDLRFYRQSLAWIEVGAVATFRETVDHLYLDNRTSNPQTSTRSEELADRYFQTATTLAELARKPPSCKVRLDRYDNETAGMFTRTVAAMRLIKSGAKASEFALDQFLTFVDNVSDISLLLSTGELKDFVTGNAPQTIDLRTYVADALVADSSSLDVDAHRYRRTLQSIVRRDYESDILRFVDRLTDIGEHIGLHLYYTLTEAFLFQLFQLFKKTDDIYFTRAALLDWYANRFSDPSSADRANSLRLDQRLQQIRGEIDDVRIYVDPLRFGQWLQDNTIEALSSALRTGSISENEIQAVRGLGTSFAEQRLPQFRLVSVINDAFVEFCSNKRYGVDSYIGRRIRHGTLKGFLYSQLLPVIDQSKYAPLLLISAAENFVQGWLSNFEAHVARWGNEIFQVRSAQKPHGLLIPNAALPNRIEVLRTAMRDIVGVYGERQNIADAQQVLFEHCWRLLEPDLRTIRHTIEDGRLTWGVIKASELHKVVPDEYRRAASALCREINTFTDGQFHSLARWFTKPMNLAPSAPISMLLQAVLTEVGAHFGDYTWTLNKEGVDDAEIVGRSYHHIYDFLYVVIFNAAKHGRKPGSITQSIRLEGTDDQSLLMQLAVRSAIADEDTIDQVRARIEEALAGDSENAMVEENRSGIRKLLRMKTDLKEIEALDITYHEREVEFTLAMRLGRSSS